MKMGIIAEDDSDVAVISEITRKLLRPHTMGFKKFVGNGSGKLRRKCAAWARTLVQQGCRWIIVVHDLDTNDERDLRTRLTGSVLPAGAEASIVLIPRREIEAWLLYDAAAIAAAFGETLRPPLPGNPESIPNPKKHLRDLVRRRYQKAYLTTIHNLAVARHINVSLLRQSRSFFPHFGFATGVRATFH
jgi:hypothetical protein